MDTLAGFKLSTDVFGAGREAGSLYRLLGPHVRQLQRQTPHFSPVTTRSLGTWRHQFASVDIFLALTSHVQIC